MSPALTPEEIQRRFTNHRPDSPTGETMDMVRAAFIRTAYEVNTLVPSGREASLMFTHLELALHYGIAQVARDNATLAEGHPLLAFDAAAATNAKCCRENP